MYVAQISISQREPLERETVSDAINTLLAALRMNGQICGREWPIAITSSGYVATALLPEKTALDVAHQNRYVREALQKLREAGLEEPECVVTEELDDAEACGCDSPSTYILYTTYVSLEAPLRCGDCFLPVPLYRVPPTKDEEYHDIISWQTYYQTCDTLQMNCTPMERTALRQLSRLDSGLTQNGLAICRRIYEATQTPAYYYLYRDKGRSVRQERKRLCPSCQGEWLLPARWNFFDFKCAHCHLVSNIAWDIG